MFKAFMDFVCTEASDAPANPEPETQDFDSHMASLYRHLSLNATYFQSVRDSSPAIPTFLDECVKLNAEFTEAPRMFVPYRIRLH